MKQMMKIALTGLMIAVVGCTVPKRITVLEMPDSTVTSLPPINIAPYLNYADVYDGVFLDYDEVIEHAAIRSKPDGISKDFWFYSKVLKKRCIVLNPEAQWLTTFEIGFKPDKLYLRSTSPRGEVRNYGLADLKEVLSSKDDYDYKFAFPNVEKGTVIDIGYEWTYSVSHFMPPLEEDVWLQFVIPCEHLRFRFSCPESWKIHVKADTPGVHIPVVTTVDSVNEMQFLSYEASKIPAYRVERFSPPVAEVSPHLTFRVGDLFVAGQFIKSINSWDEAVEALFKYEMGEAEISQDFTQQRRHSNELPPVLKQIADSLAKTAATKLDTIQAVNRYVSTTIKFSGKPHGGNAAATIKAKKGQLFDISSLTMTLLELLQIPSNLVLLHDRDDGPFDRQFITLNQFTTTAIRVKIDTTDYLLFPWVKNLPMGFIPPTFQGQQAIVLGDRSISGMWTVPFDPTGANRIIQETNANVDSQQVIHARTSVLFEGANAYGIRRSIERLQPESVKDTVRRWTLPNSANIKFDSIQLVNDTDYYRPFIVNLYYQIPNAVTVTPEETIVQVGELIAPIWDFRIAEDSTTRTQDIDVDFAQTYRRQLTLAVPPGWSMTTVTPDRHENNQFGTNVRTCRFTQDTLMIDQTTTLVRTSQPKTQIGALLTVVGERSRAGENVLVFATPHP